jgi:septum formation protein
MIPNTKQIILASESPRRAQLLRQINIPFVVRHAAINERYNGSEPIEFACELSARKARVVAADVRDAIIIAADTIVLHEGGILGKPTDAEDAMRMLAVLSGTMHEVITGFTIHVLPGDLVATDHAVTRVWFRELNQAEIDMYVRTGAPLDKAGSYGIQDDYGAVFVDRIDGCYYNVVGLPLSKLYQSLQRIFETQQNKSGT